MLVKYGGGRCESWCWWLVMLVVIMSDDVGVSGGGGFWRCSL